MAATIVASESDLRKGLCRYTVNRADKFAYILACGHGSVANLQPVQSCAACFLSSVAAAELQREAQQLHLARG